MVPASTGEHGTMSPPQYWARGAGSGHPSHPPLPFLHLLQHILGGVNRSRAGRVCPACSPGDGGQLLLSWVIYSCSFHQQGEIKVYLYSGRFGHCRRSSEGCWGLAGRDTGVLGLDTQTWDPWDRGSTSGVRGTAKLGQSPTEPQIQSRIFCPSLLPAWDGAALRAGYQAAGSPLPRAGEHSPAPPGPAYSWLCSLDLRGKAVFSEALPDELLSPPGQQLTASRTQPRKSLET